MILKNILMLIVVLSLMGCSGGDGDGPTVLPPPGMVLQLDGKLIDESGTTTSFENTEILIRSFSEKTRKVQTILAGQDGSFTATNVSSSEITITFPDNSITRYDLEITKNVEIGSLEIVVNPIFGRSQTNGIIIAPTESEQAGIANILLPINDQTTICDQNLPEVCSISVAGVATPSLGQSGTPFRLYVALQSVSPFAGGVFLESPNITVDPVSGEWNGTAFFGSLENPVRGGEIFRLFMVVTEGLVAQNTEDQLIEFNSAVDIENVVHISKFLTINIGDRE